MHPSAYSFVASIVEMTGPFDDGKRGLDIGGADHNGNARNAWTAISSVYTWDVLDIRPGEGVTIVADAAKWEPDTTYDVVLCTEVLEHTPDWHGVIDTCMTALSVGGHFVLTCAGNNRMPHSFDGDPLKPGEHYENISPRRLMEYLLSHTNFLIRSFRYDPDLGDNYVYGTRGW